MLVEEKYKLSSYDALYNLIIPEDNILRKIKEMIDFSFIYDELSAKYCIDKRKI